jgi:hypothetical protein
MSRASERRSARWVQAAIAFFLLQMFATLMFLPAFFPKFMVDAESKQTLFTLVTAVVFYFIGRGVDGHPQASGIPAAVETEAQDPWYGQERRSGHDRRRDARRKCDDRRGEGDRRAQADSDIDRRRALTHPPMSPRGDL